MYEQWSSAAWVDTCAQRTSDSSADAVRGSKAAELAYAGSHFEPSFASVAKPQDPSAKVAEDVVDAEDETSMAEGAAAADDG